MLSHLGISTNKNWSGSYANGNPIWGSAKREASSVMLTRGPHYETKIVPDVIGMGARDAVYILESRGVKVRLSGRGKVTQQSLPAGHIIKKGEVCSLKLEI